MTTAASDRNHPRHGFAPVVFVCLRIIALAMVLGALVAVIRGFVALVSAVF